MFADARIASDLQTIARSIQVPPVPYADIHSGMARESRVAQRRALRYAAIVAIFFVVLGAGLTAISSGSVRSLDARIAAALGGWPPPPPPEAVLSALSSRSGTLADAQSRVPFRIVRPTGLPSDVASMKISTTPTGIFVKATHAWHVGTAHVTFAYDRFGGRSFSLIADRFDPQSGPAPKYIFEDKGVSADGNPILVKHENFVWRNGDQVTSAVESDGTSSREIEAIRDAMHGIPMPQTETRGTFRHGSTEKLYKIPGP